MHCGMCIATCPTYQVLGDELDSPRGRIYLIKNMLEGGGPPNEKTVRHIDRCLSCLACMTTCPSGVDYMHLVDHARRHIEVHYKRPIGDRLLRQMLLWILPYPGRFRLALLGGRLGRLFRSLVPDARLRAMLDTVPSVIPPVSRNDDPQVFPADGPAKRRVALMTGCAQKALNTNINDATIRLLTRLGCEVVVASGAGCCGALAHHMGKTGQSHIAAARNVSAWAREIDAGGLDAIVINASGCGTTVKDYGHILREGPLAKEAGTVSSLTVDVTQLVSELGLPACPDKGIRVGYHAACSLQHGQRVTAQPKALLTRAGFTVAEPKDSHLCCGSAGTYSLLQPEISAALKSRKVQSLEILEVDVIAAGNLGCMVQIGSATGIPVVHTAELLDWATGGPQPPALDISVR